MLWQIILQIILIIINAFFVCAETALMSTNPNKLEKAANEGNRRAEKLQKIHDDSAKVLSYLRLAITFSGFMGAAFFAKNFSLRLVSLISDKELETALEPLSVVVLTFFISCITFTFGELIPEKLALKNPEKAAMSMVGVFRATKIIFSPLFVFLNFISFVTLKMFGVNPESESETITEEEIIMMSDAGAEKGTIDEAENRIIKNIFAFDDMTAEQVCTHRTDVSILWESDSVETWEETVHRTRHSRFPICSESVDHIIGIFNAKDYFRLDDKNRENIMKNAVHEPYFVHENMKADKLFAEMKKRGGHHFAVVVDEYGGMSGIITVTDLVEELVGDFDDDELNQHEAEFRQTGENEWIIPGITSLTDVCEELEISLDTEKYDTFGGYVIDFLGEIPKNSTAISFECDGLHIEVLEINHHRIKVCRVKKINP